MKRFFSKDEPEMMDRVQEVTPALEKDLDNLVSLNRYFGSHRLVRRFLSSWLQRDRVYRILDLATGAGDIPRSMLDWARSREITLRIDAVDNNPATLEIARKQSVDYPEISFLRNDVLSFNSQTTYDVVCCSLALHHFSEEDAALLLRRCRELSHRFVLITDLERCAATTAGVWLVTALVYSDPMTKFDGRLSARRAFSFAEMEALAAAAGWRNFGHARFLFCRQALWLDEQSFADIPQVVLPVQEGLPCPT